jgi:hypothetical protein
MFTASVISHHQRGPGVAFHNEYQPAQPFPYIHTLPKVCQNTKKIFHFPSP